MLQRKRLQWRTKRWTKLETTNQRELEGSDREVTFLLQMAMDKHALLPLASGRRVLSSMHTTARDRYVRI